MQDVFGVVERLDRWEFELTEFFEDGVVFPSQHCVEFIEETLTRFLFDFGGSEFFPRVFAVDVDDHILGFGQVPRFENHFVEDERTIVERDVEFEDEEEDMMDQDM